MRWVGTTGGPHVLSPIERLTDWQGIKGSSDLGPDDDSDYARACRTRGYLGKVLSRAGLELVVLGGEVGPVAWFPYSNGTGGALVQWLGCDGENLIFALLKDRHSLHQSAKSYSETVAFDTGPSGILTAFDATITGDEATSNGVTINLRSGRYDIFASYIKTEGCEVVLREIMPKQA